MNRSSTPQTVAEVRAVLQTYTVDQLAEALIEIQTCMFCLEAVGIKYYYDQFKPADSDSMVDAILEELNKIGG